ncbi:hypothetical protein A1QO_00660 [Vibrio genomosp. F10 str. ZF-129]|uniref:Uncharacterized protein n=1 Tax=Vibrio genomosp. F10 str. ZF-129 TaxID=1187848 RepID=A0A1E5BGA4_9VIBR|nr:hypothetical protein [Vibrio genomosp. F10]OEE35303.1 hypothetical protein A1QO_00660 [Vibrio genomosp. F10 str. ZF-129]
MFILSMQVEHLALLIIVTIVTYFFMKAKIRSLFKLLNNIAIYAFFRAGDNCDKNGNLKGQAHIENQARRAREKMVSTSPKPKNTRVKVEKQSDFASESFHFTATEEVDLSEPTFKRNGFKVTDTDGLLTVGK